ncbi:hypothetical protein EG328_011622 [Venturia inaequalis]|uniref:Uncharacterized protein n=1 Tax=Venturia inaequalis TaxID=5025 RepID=A0A8H3V5H7_VENIN|nr:hypothetical protein EG328_011622 [Venturia inaequalis]
MIIKKYSIFVKTRDKGLIWAPEYCNKKSSVLQPLKKITLVASTSAKGYDIDGA